MLAIAAPIAGGTIGTSLRVVRRDAAKHRSPNAGGPERAAVGGLGLALAGPRRYAGHEVAVPFRNAAATHAAVPADLGRAPDLDIAASVIEAAV